MHRRNLNVIVLMEESVIYPVQVLFASASIMYTFQTTKDVIVDIHVSVTLVALRNKFIVIGKIT
jgi:hypothetical protein